MGWRDDVEAGFYGPGAEALMHRLDDARTKRAQAEMLEATLPPEDLTALELAVRLIIKQLRREADALEQADAAALPR